MVSGAKLANSLSIYSFRISTTAKFSLVCRKAISPNHIWLLCTRPPQPATACRLVDSDWLTDKYKVCFFRCFGLCSCSCCTNIVRAQLCDAQSVAALSAREGEGCAAQKPFRNAFSRRALHLFACNKSRH